MQADLFSELSPRSTCKTRFAPVGRLRNVAGNSHVHCAGPLSLGHTPPLQDDEAARRCEPDFNRPMAEAEEMKHPARADHTRSETVRADDCELFGAFSLRRLNIRLPFGPERIHLRLRQAVAAPHLPGEIQNTPEIVL